MIGIARAAASGGTTLPHPAVDTQQTNARRPGLRHAALGLLCRVLVWAFAVVAAGEVGKFGETGQVRSASAAFEAVLEPVVAERAGAQAAVCGQPDPAPAAGKTDPAESCDEADAVPRLGAPSRAALSIVAAILANVPADRSPPGKASARAPPFTHPV
ncbi:MAG: hypothetical protein KF914_19730 [Rhizobiaceae bacterium]|nr:hypothetical protein [Rhizobiaceae bacterium]